MALATEDALDEALLPAYLRSIGLASGAEVRISGSVENALVPGRYSIDCWVRLDDPGGDRAVQGLRLLDFTVEGPAAAGGVVDVGAELTVTAVPEGGDG